MAKETTNIYLNKPEDSPQQLADKLNTLHSTIDVSVIKGAMSRDDFEKYKGNNDKIVSGYEDRINYNIERGTKKLADMRYHGGGLPSVSTDSTLTGNGTPSSPLHVISGGGGIPGGSNTQVQFNDSGSFGGATATWDKVLETITLPADGGISGLGDLYIYSQAGSLYLNALNSSTALRIQDQSGKTAILNTGSISSDRTFTFPNASGTLVTGGGTASGTNTGDQTNISGNAATVTINANLTGAVTSSGNATSLGSFSSANLLSALTDETGTGVSVFNAKPTFVGTIQTVTAMGAQALDGSTANVFTRTLAASETFTQSNFSTGQCFMVEVKQGSGTSYTVTWFSGVTWVTSGATAPVQTTTTNGFTTYGFRCTGSNAFLGYLVGTN